MEEEGGTSALTTTLFGSAPGAEQVAYKLGEEDR